MKRAIVALTAAIGLTVGMTFPMAGIGLTQVTLGCSDTIRRSRLRLSRLRRLRVRASSLASCALLRISGGPAVAIGCS